MLMNGLTIVPHTLAREVRTEYRVTRWAAGHDKKRKNWRVMRVEINRPGAYQIGNTIYMHPELVEKLRALPPNALAQADAACGVSPGAMGSVSCCASKT